MGIGVILNILNNYMMACVALVNIVNVRNLPEIYWRWTLFSTDFCRQELIEVVYYNVRLHFLSYLFIGLNLRVRINDSEGLEQ
jgi:hypothetical protein